MQVQRTSEELYGDSGNEVYIRFQHEMIAHCQLRTWKSSKSCGCPPFGACAVNEVLSVPRGTCHPIGCCIYFWAAEPEEQAGLMKDSMGLRSQFMTVPAVRDSLFAKHGIPWFPDLLQMQFYCQHRQAEKFLSKGLHRRRLVRWMTAQGSLFCSHCRRLAWNLNWKRHRSSGNFGIWSRKMMRKWMRTHDYSKWTGTVHYTSALVGILAALRWMAAPVLRWRRPVLHAAGHVFCVEIGTIVPSLACLLDRSSFCLWNFPLFLRHVSHVAGCCKELHMLGMRHDFCHGSSPAPTLWCSWESPRNSVSWGILGCAGRVTAGKLCFYTQNLDRMWPNVTLVCEGEGGVLGGDGGRLLVSDCLQSFCGDWALSLCLVTGLRVVVLSDCSYLFLNVTQCSHPTQYPWMATQHFHIKQFSSELEPIAVFFRGTFLKCMRIVCRKFEQHCAPHFLFFKKSQHGEWFPSPHNTVRHPKDDYGQFALTGDMFMYIIYWNASQGFSPIMSLKKC